MEWKKRAAVEVFVVLLGIIRILGNSLEDNEALNLKVLFDHGNKVGGQDNDVLLYEGNAPRSNPTSYLYSLSNCTA